MDEEQFKKIMNYIDQGKSEGAKLNCGGKRKGDKGFYVEPTVFSEVSISGSSVQRCPAPVIVSCRRLLQVPDELCLSHSACQSIFGS